MASPVCLVYILSKSESLGGRHRPWCPSLCPAAGAHRPDRFRLRLSNRRQSEWRLESHPAGLLIPFPVWFKLRESTTITQRHCGLTASLLAGICGEKKIMGKIQIHGTQLKGSGEEPSRSPVCSWGQLLWELCLCSPSPGALIPDWADLDKKLLSLPLSSPHPRGRCAALYTTALDSIKPEQNHLLLRLQPL